jgi:hypothetical protein
MRAAIEFLHLEETSDCVGWAQMQWNTCAGSNSAHSIESTVAIQT